MPDPSWDFGASSIGILSRLFPEKDKKYRESVPTAFKIESQFPQ
ncbi:hypothetical protein LEP1GSC193_3668 [Leptospira alstonii serovar Pingchang str. 80-412]|uniref:Uncharacterized protein n=1 Tax=Leptospira alstonii serovar Pingchang str. 80-412 TaxID=1218564 RepID=T0G4W8_9LEPT|nr:hypothetical protein LEP1GSC193_3668 [Leptospira alstonii serovar Pingchang str. 80-412]